MNKDTSMSTEMPLTTLASRLSMLYMVAVIVWITVLAFQWPVYGSDTDLWFHMDAGRYILQNGQLPTETYFSFLEPPREVINYAWIFDILVYKTFELTGYQGLVILRAVFMLAILLVITAFIWEKMRKTEHAVFLAFIWSLVLFIIIPRFHMIRPHIISLILVSVFIYALETRHRWLLYSLPLLAVFWMNMHGVYLPVMLIIIVAYLLEFGISRLRTKEHIKNSDAPFILACILSMAAAYATPHGIKIIQLPAYPSELMGQFVNEMVPVNLIDISRFDTNKLIPDYLTTYNILLYTAVTMALASAYARKFRISHLLLAAFAIYLPFKGIRFVSTSVILFMPVISSNILKLRFSKEGAYLGRAVTTLIVIVFISVPFFYFHDTININDHYPFSRESMPIGTVKFLDSVGSGGKILNHPNKGGYYRWELYPRYKILIDMEGMPTFTYDDFFYSSHIFNDEKILGHYISKYDPDYLAIPLQISNASNFNKLIAEFPEYKAVFFDDSSALFVDSSQHPDIAEKYDLGKIDPFTFLGSTGKSLVARYGTDLLIKTANQIIATYPECGLAHQILIVAYRESGEYEKALPHSDILIKEYPGTAVGYTSKADILELSGKTREAVEMYEKILDMPSLGVSSDQILRKAGILYFRLGEYEKAYEDFVRAPSFYRPSTDFEYLYAFGISAYKTGRPELAEMYLPYALSMAPADKEEEKELISNALDELKK